MMTCAMVIASDRPEDSDVGLSELCTVVNLLYSGSDMIPKLIVAVVGEAHPSGTG